MTGTPTGPPDESSRRHERRPCPFRAGWMGRLRPGDWWRRLRSVVRAAPRDRLLFLDDDPRRAELFLMDHPRAVWVTNVPDCLARLTELWEEVHLDHDLGGKIFVDSSDTDCGMEVIRWLCKEQPAHLKTTRFYVHTHNATAGLLMVLLMQGGGYKAEFRPFGLDLRNLLAHNEPGPAAGLASRLSRWIDLRGPLRRMRRAHSARERGEPLATSGQDSEATLPDPVHTNGETPPCSAPGEAYRTAPGSAPEIQPPPRTRSS